MKKSKLSTEASGPSRWPWIAGLFAAFFAVLEIYWPAVNGPFVFDDEYLSFLDPGFLENGLTRIGFFQRPLLTASYWMNLRFSGPEPFSFHLTNIFLHFLNGLLVYLIVRKVLELAGSKNDLVSAFAAALFLVHPVQTESVAYVAGRSETMSVLLLLGSFALFLYTRRNGIGWVAAAGVTLLFGAAFLTKEHAAVLPGLLILTDVFWNQNGAVDAVKRNWRLYAPIFIMGAAGVLFVARIIFTADTAGFRVMPWYQYFFTQWRAVWVYIRLFVAPFDLNADYAFPISHSPMEHFAVLGLIGLAAVLGVAWFYRKQYPMALYGLLVFLLLLAPTSSVVPIKDTLAERRLYLPFIGLLFVACDLLRSWKSSRNVQVAAMSAVLLVFAYTTYARSAVWGDPVRLWEDTVAKSPHNARAQFQLAVVHYTHERCAEAITHFAKAESLGYKDDTLYVDWGLAHNCLKQFDEALAKLRRAALYKDTAHLRAHIGMVLAQQNRLDEALESLNSAAALDGGYELTYVFRGNVHFLRQDLDKAEADFRQALALKPDDEVARQGLAAVAQRRGSVR